MRLKDASVQAVLSAGSIVDVISGYTSLRKRGVTYSGLCPFHQEKTPSFTVSADKGLYYCFGCGEGGDLVRFVERMENLSFAEAIEQLGERFGVAVEYEEGTGADPGRKDRETRLLLASWASRSFILRYCAMPLALSRSATTRKVSPESGMDSRPRTSTGVEGPASSMARPRSSNMARTLPKVLPTI